MPRIDGHENATIATPLLVRVEARHLEDASLLEDLARWRNAARDSFYRQALTNAEEVRSRLAGFLEPGSDRVLFLVVLPDGGRVGHIGFSEITAASAKFGNVLRGEAAPRDTMYEACRQAIRWSRDDLDVKVLHLDVFSDNLPAVRLYTRLGFTEVDRVWHVGRGGPEALMYVRGDQHLPGRWVVCMRLEVAESGEAADGVLTDLGDGYRP